ncbi:Microtubule-severing ATPase [Flammeovirgaceae bacterium 311]|nr:Microtubule-severing ATPase [Flammeovirgaceae bacterium 311]
MDEMIKNLEEALLVSPDNLPLRRMLARKFAETGNAAKAEEHWKIVLEQQPGDRDAQLGLAQACYALQKYSTALVVLEEMAANNPPLEAMLLYAKALIKDGDLLKARDVYAEVLVQNSEMQDAELDAQFRQAAAFEAESSTAEAEDNRVERPRITFEDVGGMEAVKEEIELKIIRPLQHPELYKAYGKKIGGGILLYGPPGCGKTYLARATAGQVKARFINVGINDVLDMWIGNSEKNLHQLFELARAHKPCVLFFDEVDALGASRSDMRQSSGRNLINQFLSELDGLESDNEGVLVLGATNAPWHLDAAFRRPGRFDRIIFVAPPDAAGRATILQLLLRDKPTQQLDLQAVAKKTENYSGADLQALVDICIEQKLRQSFRTGVPEPISTRDLLEAAGKHRASTQEWFNTARNYALYANQTGLYDDILEYLRIKK